MSKRKGKWWLRKPSGNIPPSRKWVRHKYGRETITELGIFNDDPIFVGGRVYRMTFDKPIHCEEVKDDIP